MIQTASILWAVLATCGAVAVYVLMRRENRALRSYNRELIGALDREHDRYRRLWHNARAISATVIDAEDRLRKIERSRHNSAKHARACQLTKQREAIAARTAELQQNISDRTSKIRSVA